MEQTLLDKLDCFRRRIRKLSFYYGFSLLAAIVFGSILFFGLLDWRFRFDSPRGRFVFVLLDLTLLSILTWWFFLRPMRWGLSNLQLAFAIERHYPEFGESLISTVQFLQNRTNTFQDSFELEDHLILKTIRKLEQIELDRIVDTKPVRRIVLRSGMAIAVILMFAFWNRGEAAIAIKRFFLPYGGYSWPKKTQFVLLTKENTPLFQNRKIRLRKPQGEVFTLYVRNEKGELPANTQLQVFYPEEDNLIIEESLKKVSKEDESGFVQELGLIQIPIRQDKMQFRVLGGDDLTRWYTIDMVPPPQLKKFQLEIVPPLYTGKKPIVTEEGIRQLRAVLGTRVRILARSNKKLKSARLISRNKVSRNFILEASRMDFRSEFLVREPGLFDWQIDLEDVEGFRNPQNPHFEIRGFEDNPPQIKLLSPAPLRNRDEILATSHATIPIDVRASDDFGLKQIALNFKRHHSEEAHKSRSIYRSGRKKLSEKKIKINYQWELSNESVVEGMLLGIHVEARDHFRDPFGSLTMNSHVSRSHTRLLRIVSLAEKTNELLSRREELIGKLEIQKKIQADLVDRSSDLIIQLEQARKWRTKQDYRHLTMLEKRQRIVTTSILDEKTGLSRKATLMEEEARQNKIRDPVLLHSLNYLDRELNSLSTQHLNRIERDLIVVRKCVEDYLTNSSSSRNHRYSTSIPQQIEHLKNARFHQNQVLAGLESLLLEFRRKRNLKEIGEELQNILEEEKQIARLTKETKRETFSKSESELTSQQRADLHRLAEKQRRLSSRFGKLETDLEDSPGVVSKIRQSNQLLRNLAHQFSESRLQNKMQQASRELRINILGTAEDTISEILGSLHNLLRVFAAKENRDLDAIIAQVKRIERETASLKIKQKAYTTRLRKVVRSDRGTLASLARLERQLLTDVEMISHTIRQWDAQPVSDSFDRLQNRLQITVDTLQNRHVKLSHSSSQECLSLFSHALAELLLYRRFLESEREKELLNRIVTEIAAMKDRQHDLVQRTKKLQFAFREAGRWTRPLFRKLFSLRNEQKKLQIETINLTQKLKDVPVFETTMRRTAIILASIVERLRKRHTDNETVSLQLSVIKQFDELLKSLDVQRTDTNTDTALSKKRTSQTDRSGLISKLSRFKLIESIQQEILKKTIEIESNRKAQKGRSHTLERDLKELVERQKSLRESAQKILSISKNVDPQQKQLQKVVSQMQDVWKKLSQGKTGAENQGIQKQIIAKLERLIEILTQQQSESTQRPNPTYSPQRKNSKSKLNPKSTGKSSKAGASAGNPGSQSKTKIKNGEPSQKQHNMQTRIAERKKLIDAVWGHLPESIRQRMLNQTNDSKFLMQYREQIKRYFESLATDPRKNRR